MPDGNGSGIHTVTNTRHNTGDLREIDDGLELSVGTNAFSLAAPLTIACGIPYADV